MTPFKSVAFFSPKDNLNICNSVQLKPFKYLEIPANLLSGERRVKALIKEAPGRLMFLLHTTIWRKNTVKEEYVMRKLRQCLTWICLLSVVILYSCSTEQPIEEQEEKSWAEYDASYVRVSLTYTAQSGTASNQFALWVEDETGQYIATLYATQYTANKGYKDRPQSQPIWVEKANPEDMTKQTLDIVAGATPKSGALYYEWRYTDDAGRPIDSQARYTIRLEATLRWDNYLLWTAVIEGAEVIKTSEQRVASRQENNLDDDAAEWDMIQDIELIVVG